MDSRKKILLGMLLSNGDCLMATVLARQIKKDFPDCVLTWAISNFCRPVIEHNPFVDEIWEIKLSSREAGLKDEWRKFRSLALERKNAGEFDEIYFTQIYPDNVHHFDGTTRGTIYAGYPHPITVDARPTLRLQPEECKKVEKFATLHNLDKFQQVILFECSALSGQSFVTPDWALAVSNNLVARFPELVVILSSHLPLSPSHKRILTAENLSLRENAALTRFCTLLVGCSSGITWMATTDEAKRLPMIQFLNRGIGFRFASVSYDHRYWGLDDSGIIETTDFGINHATDLISSAIEGSWEATRARYHRHLRPRFISLLKYAFMFARKGRFGKAWQVANRFIRRNYFPARRKL